MAEVVIVEYFRGKVFRWVSLVRTVISLLIGLSYIPIGLSPLDELEQLLFLLLCIGIDCIGIASMSHWHWPVVPVLWL